MRAIVALCLLISTTSLHAQDSVLFKIITYSLGATIDGQPVTIGLDVHASASQLFVPEGGRVGLITADGHAFKLSKPMDVSEVNAFVQRQLEEEANKRLGLHRGAAHPDSRDKELVMPLAPVNDHSETFEDSVFLFWVPGDYLYPNNISQAGNSSYKSYTVRFSNLYDETMSTIEVAQNWIVAKYPEPHPKKDRNVLYQVSCSVPKSTTDMHIIYNASEKKRENARSLLAPIEKSLDVEYLRCAFFDLNNFKLDMNMSLYRIITRKLTTSDPILQRYLANQTSEYHLGLMELNR